MSRTCRYMLPLTLTQTGFQLSICNMHLLFETNCIDVIKLLYSTVGYYFTTERYLSPPKILAVILI